MSHTLWVLKEGQESDGWDHSVILAHENRLDRLARHLGVTRLSEFYDWSVLEADYQSPDEPTFVEPGPVRESLTAIIAALKSGEADGLFKPETRDHLVEELEDCLDKVNEAAAEDCRLRLSIIP